MNAHAHISNSDCFGAVPLSLALKHDLDEVPESVELSCFVAPPRPGSAESARLGLRFDPVPMPDGMFRYLGTRLVRIQEKGRLFSIFQILYPSDGRSRGRTEGSKTKTG